ncbi:MAG: acetyl-CoA carboxylase biotin carboxylase subunit [Halioglobus sp.]|nr:acetyl-CoA carboxylase biotin carboxylase subunit [Halioglobus sp.]
MSRFTSILVANRGEIACRILRAARGQGYRTIAVYSESDASAPHVQMADEAIPIGPGPASQSYLVTNNILNAAMSSGAGAIHPGYGFLSENADFAAKCETAGLVFIGPSAHAIHVMGNKAEAKRRMIDAGVACVPGYEGDDQNDSTLLAEAAKIEMPLMVKAAAGGGGRGMRLVHARGDMANAISLARAEAESTFGNGDLILEKAIVRPRHVEVQVFGDEQGNIVHLGERDCSIQRRHQKVVEEAPCPIMTDTLRSAMGSAAVTAARSIDYCGAGTVEFLLDERGEFYFLEMNTRLQVEHPVTELITGIDLVALQFQIAQGEPLGFTQEDVTLSGHAIEVRLYAEDAARDFLPTSGPVELWSPPAGTGIRVDDGITTGQAVSPFYDPMVAKIIAYGRNREIARRRLIEALRDTVLFGTRNNCAFLVACLQKQRFAAGQATTAFVEEEFSTEELSEPPPGIANSAVAAALELTLEYQASQSNSVIVAPQLKNWSSASPLVSRKRYVHDGANHDLFVSALSSSRYRVSQADSAVIIEVHHMEGSRASISIDGKQYDIRYHCPEDGRIYLAMDGHSALYSDMIRLDGLSTAGRGSGDVVAPMHGLLIEVRVAEGDDVKTGQVLAVLEAMKMHYEVIAETSGRIDEILVGNKTQVAAEELLMKIQANE